jgi:hypothetical protein
LGDWLIEDCKRYDEPLMSTGGSGDTQGYDISSIDATKQPVRAKIFEIIKAAIGPDCLWLDALRAIRADKAIPIADFIRENDRHYFQISPEKALQTQLDWQGLMYTAAFSLASFLSIWWTQAWFMTAFGHRQLAIGRPSLFAAAPRRL